MKYIVISFIIVVFIFFGYQLSNFETKNIVNQEVECVGNAHSDILNFIGKEKSKSLNNEFKNYLDSRNICAITDLKNDIKKLEIVFKNKKEVQEVFIEILTNKLYALDSTKFNSNDLAYISKRLLWVEKFKPYSEIDEEYQDLYLTIYDYWMTKISNRLQICSEAREDLRYSYLFSYLTTRCNEKKYSVVVKRSKTENVIESILNNKIGHLINASWNQSSIALKIFFSVFFAITLYSYYLLVLKVKKIYEKK